MIILSTPSEKELDGLKTVNATATHVYYAVMPSPQATPPPPDAPMTTTQSGSGDAQVNGLARRLSDDLYIDDSDLPPAYEDPAPMQAVRTTPAVYRASASAPVGNVKDPNLFKGKPDDEGSNPNNDRQNASGPGNVHRGLNSEGSTTFEGASRAPAFEPLVMHSKSKKLEDGFFAMLPPTDVQPHPFAQRDVGEADWKKFLEDLQTSARLSASDRPSQSSSQFQSAERTNFFQNMGNMFRSMSSGKQADEGNHRGPAALVDTWNQNFFHRRRLDVTLAKGSRRLNGDKSLPPPDYITSESENTANMNGSGSGASRNVSGGNENNITPFVLPPTPPTLPTPPAPHLHHAHTMPTMPQMPQIPQMPQMPQMPHMPQMQPIPPIPPIPPISAMPPMPAMPGAFPNGHPYASQKYHHSTSSLSSDSSDSDSDSDSDSEDDVKPREHGHNHNHDDRHGNHLAHHNSCSSCASCSSSRAGKRAGRAERRAKRRERRQHRREKRRERKDVRWARKLAKFEAKVASRTMGLGAGPMMNMMNMGPRGMGMGGMSRGVGWGRGGCGFGRGGMDDCYGFGRGRGFGRGFGRGGFGPGFGGGPFGFVQGLASVMGKEPEEDGYYRLIVTDRV